MHCAWLFLTGVQGSGRGRMRWPPAARAWPSSGGRAAARYWDEHGRADLQPLGSKLLPHAADHLRCWSAACLLARSLNDPTSPSLSLPLPLHTPFQGKLKGRVREYCALLRLQPPVVDQALHVLEQAISTLMGNWRRDLLAASAAYAACRYKHAAAGQLARLRRLAGTDTLPVEPHCMLEWAGRGIPRAIRRSLCHTPRWHAARSARRLNSLPLTLADLAVSTQIDARQLGRHYTALCRLLALQPPLLLAADLLPRSCDRVTAELVQQGALAAELAATLRRDAAMLVDWMQV